MWIKDPVNDQQPWKKVAVHHNIHTLFRLFSSGRKSKSSLPWMVVAMTTAGPEDFPPVFFAHHHGLNVGRTIYWHYIHVLSFEALRFLREFLIMPSAMLNGFSSPGDTYSVKKQSCNS